MTGGTLPVLLRLLRLFRPYRGWMMLGALLACITMLANVALMAIAGAFIAAMAIAGLAGVLMNYFLPAAGIRLFAILRTGGRYSERLVTHEATFRLLARLRIWLFRSLEPLSPAQMQSHRGADLVARLQADVDTLQHAYLRLFSPLAVAVAGTLMVVGLLSLYSPAVALLVLALLLLAGGLVPGAVHTASAAPGARTVRAKAALRVAVVDALQGMTDLRVHGASGRKVQEIATLADSLGGDQLRVARLSALSEGTVGLCASLALWGAALIAAAGVADGTLQRPDVPMLALAALACFELVAPLPAVMQRIGEIAAAARRIFAVADQVPAIVSPARPSPVPLDAGIVLRDVRLHYAGAPRPALDGVSLDLSSGRRIAVTGPSGAGKSSLARVLLRFWDYGGEIRLGGHDLRAYHLEDVRNMIGLVSQDTQLFNATIRNNLRIAAPDADDAAMESAMRTALLHDFVLALPDGYDTWIGEGGVRLSVGQARRLAIARVILRDPPILLLDEATEGLDAETGRALMSGLYKRMYGRTLLVVTHNVDEVQDFVDEVFWMQDGRLFSRETPG